MPTKKPFPTDLFGMPLPKKKSKVTAPAVAKGSGTAGKAASSKAASGKAAAKNKKGPGAFEQVYGLVVKIPRGRVLTYGAISILINRRLSAAAVGWAMRALPDDETKTKHGSPYHSKSVPWHRVINSKGGISTTNEPGIPSGLQQTLLEAEGVKFNDQGTIDLDKYLWKP